MFENRALRKIFRPKRDDITEEWRKLHNEERSDLYLSHSIVWVIKWRRIRWVWHIAFMGERRGVYRVLVGKPEGRDHLEEPGVDGRIILTHWHTTFYNTWRTYIYIYIYGAPILDVSRSHTTTQQSR